MGWPRWSVAGLACAQSRPAAHRDVAVDDQQLLSGHVKLAAQLVRFPIYYSESLVVRVKN